MEVSRIRALRGPNLWSKNTAIEAIVSCADAECSIDNLPDFEARLRARLPQTGLLRPEGHQGAVSIAHVLQIVSLTLQAYAGCPVTFGRASPTTEPGVFQVVVEYSEEEVGRLAMDLAQQLVQAALDDTPFDLADALKRLRELDEDVRLGPSPCSIVNAATARNIPYRRLTQGSMVQFGWGSKQRRIQAAETDLTSAISESIAQDKDLTKMLLDAAGVPVPLGRSVTTAEDAWAAAQELGGPVVVKPRDGSQGRGVAVNIETRERVIQAFEVAEEISSEVIVERYIPGHDFRLLVVGGALVAASRRDPPQVTGDGVHTIRQLVEQVNADPLRGDGHATSLTKIRFDDIALATLKKQGFDADSVPAPGTLIFLRNNANLSTGGSATDVTDEVHPEMAARAVSAARMIGLDICGVDVVAESVHYPLEEQNGGVVEVPKKDYLLGTKYASLPVPTRRGYTFIRWTTEDGVEVVATDTVKTSVTRLVAQWEVYVDKFAPAILEEGEVVFTTDGNAKWTLDDSVGSPEAPSARSGAIGDSQATSLFGTVTGPGVISFKRKVSSESGWDFLRFFADGVEKLSWSGEQDWGDATCNLTALGPGEHVLEWRYVKDGSVSRGSDCVWIDRVQWRAV